MIRHLECISVEWVWWSNALPVHCKQPPASCWHTVCSCQLNLLPVAVQTIHSGGYKVKVGALQPRDVVVVKLTVK